MLLYRSSTPPRAGSKRRIDELKRIGTNGTEIDDTDEDMTDEEASPPRTPDGQGITGSDGDKTQEDPNRNVKTQAIDLTNELVAFASEFGKNKGIISKKIKTHFKHICTVLLRLNADRSKYASEIALLNQILNH